MHFTAGEYDKAREYASENTCRMLDILDILVELNKDKTDSIRNNPLRAEDINFIRTEKKGKEAVLYYLSENGTEQRLYMIRERGKWVVDLRKEDTFRGKV